MIFVHNEVLYFTINSYSSFVTDSPLAGFGAQSPPLPTIGSSLFPRPNLAPSSSSSRNLQIIIGAPFWRCNQEYFWNILECIYKTVVRKKKKDWLLPYSPSPGLNLAWHPSSLSSRNLQIILGAPFQRCNQEYFGLHI